MRKQIAAANWKMNLTLSEGLKLAEDILSNPIHLNENQIVLMAVPFPYLISIKTLLKDQSNIFICAQNLASTSNGAFTGEVSAEMLKSIEVRFALIGHSERRDYFGENNEILAKKVDQALLNGIQPVFCCGEPLNVREANQQNSFVEAQLKASLFHLTEQQMQGFIIAYEPIWAIGTGKTATSEQAQEMHQHIRNVIAAQYGIPTAESASILYGGSVKASNANELFGKQDVDGGLVGGASLNAAEFYAIINSLK